MNPSAPSTARQSPRRADLDLDAFVRDGYLAIRGAVNPDTVTACQESTRAAMDRRGVYRDDPGNWPRSSRAWATSGKHSSRPTWLRP